MSRRIKFIAGGLVIAAALGYLVFTGVSRSVVYFVTPSELGAAPVPGKAYRLGGMVKPGTLKWNPKTVDLDFVLSDGQGTIAVKHKGAPPDLFAEGRGAVVEGTLERGRILPILADHGQALRGVQGPPRPGPGRVQGAHEDPPRRRRSVSA